MTPHDWTLVISLNGAIIVHALGGVRRAEVSSNRFLNGPAATLLHAIGLNHERLTYPQDGRPGILTDVAITKAKLQPELLA